MDFQKALQALPTVATSPLALIAYLVLIGAWAAITLKVRRNRHLLANLEKLPEKDRLAALQLEMGGGLIVEAGVSADEWIRARSRLYLIVGFIVLCATAVTISVLAFEHEAKPRSAVSTVQLAPKFVAAAVPTPTAPPAEGAPSMRAGVSTSAATQASHAGEPLQLASNAAPQVKHLVPHKAAAHVGSRPEPIEVPTLKGTDAQVPASSPLYTVNYVSTRTAAGVSISYELPYLDLVRKGGPVTGVPFGLTSKFGWRFPEISIKTANNTTRAMSIDEVHVRVKKSRVNNEPIPVIFSKTNANIEVRNEGWGPIVDPVWRLVAVPLDMCDSAPPSLDGARELKQGTFSTMDTVPVLPILTSALRTQDEVCIFGRLEYGMDGTQERRSLRFSTTVYTEMRSHEPAPATAKYDLVLEAGREASYTVPVAQQLEPSTTDHFALVVSSDRSASYDLEISLGTTGAPATVDGAVTIDIFVPRTVGDALVASRQ